MIEYHISMTWDSDAEVWYAVCDDIPLTMESESFDKLIKKVKLATPEILEMNGKAPECILSFVSACKVEVA